jgi:putative transposase
MNYRRSKSLGSTFFFTLVTYQRQKLFENIDNINLLRDCIRDVKKYRPFKMEAFVIMPDHLHFIWTLPEGDNDFSTRWQIIKNKFTRNCLLRYDPQPDMTRIKKGEQCIWQRRFWEHQIRDEKDFEKHVDYIHYNPVKHGYATMASDWPYSSFHHYVKMGVYPINWGGDGCVNIAIVNSAE